ncbi:LOW QUALITY PROTEIN: uncharacterized protein LOC108111666 [Drosophila eugracilis]|uniref:LOW QUALITY PROTEIN: uncharacterized protein LOC108111666 n=1 Tax=Drosophila eugracilis TaxID=29029 RepID=UPI001BDA62F6|nr:LOW QUALITY PROTEIN: uncharacterized protein LOC108111666 [Drosophila eugracilis]
MRLTLAWLSVCLAIYCGGGHGHGNVVLSLPPSLIATATKAALSHHQQQQKKDARVLFDSPTDALRDMLHNNDNGPMNSGKFSLSDVEQQAPPQQSEDFNRNADDLGARQSAPQEIAMGMGLGLGLGLGPTTNFRATPPHRYWGNRCQGRSGASTKCPQEYYRTMLAARNKEALARLHLQLSSMQDSDSEITSSDSDDSDEDVDDEEQSNNEVFMLLTGEQDLIKFLHWAMQLLYPIQRPFGNLSDGAAENYHPGMFLWKKLNLSGHLEPPLIVDEPQYVLVRREKLFDGYQFGDMSKENDPFIPPRGRKHTSPDLDALMNRFEPFVPNRGKRDKVKDLFKYDDLFYPHRGKKHRNLFQVDDPFFATRGKKLQLRDLYNNDDPFVPNRGKRHLTASGGKWTGERVAGKWPDDSDNNWPQRMSTHKINGYDQSVRPSLSMEDAAASFASSWRLPANRLHSTRSMSADQQQQQQELQQQPLLMPHVRFIGNPNMRQQQVKTSSWPVEERLRRSIPIPQGEQNDAHETQLTQSHPANPHLDTDSNNLNI